MTIKLDKVDPNKGSVVGLYDATITGEGLELVTNLRFGGRIAPILSRTSTELMVRVPQRNKPETVDLTLEYLENGKKASKKIHDAFQYTAYKPSVLEAADPPADDTQPAQGQVACPVAEKKKKAAAALKRKKLVEDNEASFGVKYYTTANGATVVTYEEKVGGGEIRCYLASIGNPKFDGKVHLHIISGVEGYGGGLAQIAYDRSLYEADSNGKTLYGGYKSWYDDQVTVHDMTHGGTEEHDENAAPAVVAAMNDPTINKARHVICLNWCHSASTYRDLLKTGFA